MAPYDVIFPVRSRVLAMFSRDEIELAARIAFWQNPPDDCTVLMQVLTLEWTEDLLGSEARVIRVSGDVDPPVLQRYPPARDGSVIQPEVAGDATEPFTPDEVPDAVPVRVTKLSELDRSPAVRRRRR